MRFPDMVRTSITTGTCTSCSATWIAGLSRYIDVEVGRHVATGDKIGEIGPRESAENGGYKAHLHWGVARSSFSSAPFAGYADDRDSWYNPIALVGRENNPNGLDYARLISRARKSE